MQKRQATSDSHKHTIVQNPREQPKNHNSSRSDSFKTDSGQRTGTDTEHQTHSLGKEKHLPSNCRARRLPSHRSSRGVIPRMKNSQTRQPAAQKPQPGPFPTGPYSQADIRNINEQFFRKMTERKLGRSRRTCQAAMRQGKCCLSPYSLEQGRI